MSVKAIKSVTQNIEVIKENIADEKLISGASETQVWNAFSDASEQFHVGHWGSGPCKIKVSYTENELCILIKGRARVTDEAGASQEFGVGEPFVIQSGFEGTWESIGDVVKIYAIFEDAETS